MFLPSFLPSSKKDQYSHLVSLPNTLTTTLPLRCIRGVTVFSRRAVSVTWTSCSGNKAHGPLLISLAPRSTTSRYCWDLPVSRLDLYSIVIFTLTYFPSSSRILFLSCRLFCARPPPHALRSGYHPALPGPLQVSLSTQSPSRGHVGSSTAHTIRPQMTSLLQPGDS